MQTPHLRESHRLLHGRPAAIDPLERRVLFAVSVRTVPLDADPIDASSVSTDAAVDAAGDIFTTCQNTSGVSEVIEVPAGSTTPEVLATFGRLDNGAYSKETPRAHLLLDGAGDLFGVSHFYSYDTNPDGTDLLWELPARSNTIGVLGRFTAAQGIPTSLTRDAAGDLFGTLDTNGDASATRQYNASVFECPADGSGLVMVPVGNAFTASYTVAADATGNLFGIHTDFSGPDDFEVYEIARGMTTATSLATLSLTKTVGDGAGAEVDADPPLGLAINAGDDVIITTGSGRVLELPVGGSTTVTLATLPTNSSIRTNPVVDGAGNVFAQAQDQTDGTYHIYEVPAAGGTPTDVAATGTPPVDGDLAIEGSGNLYGTDAERSTIFEVTGSPAAPIANSPTPTPTPTPTPSPTPTPTSTGISPDFIASKLPATVIMGVKAKGTPTITLALTNTTGVAIKGPVKLSIDATAGGATVGTSLATLTRNLKLRAGGKATVAVPVHTLPSDIGTYTISATAIDPDGTAIASAAGPTLTVVAATIDLSVSVATNPTTVAPGRIITILVTVTNDGNVDSPGRLSISAGISTDGTTMTLPLVTIAKSVRVAAGGKKPCIFRLRAKVPTGTAPGQYQVFSTIRQGGIIKSAVAASPILISD